MKKKIALALSAVLFVSSLAFAGFDQYTSKNYTTLLSPNVITASNGAFSNAVDGVAVAGLVGKGCVVIQYVATNMATSSLSFSFSSSATTNGTYTTYTNADGVSSWAYTNAAGVATIKFNPNAVSKYLRTTVTPTAVTNGACSVILVTE